MKKQNPNNHHLHSSLAVSTTIDELEFLEELVEKLAYSCRDEETTPEILQDGLESMRTNSIEAYVSGNVFLSGEQEIKLPFITCFFFTCIKGQKRNNLLWRNSLS
jgi:hypothetical protein